MENGRVPVDCWNISEAMVVVRFQGVEDEGWGRLQVQSNMTPV